MTHWFGNYNKGATVESQRNKIQWGQILVTAAITLAISILGGVILYNLTNEEPYLTYETFPAASFSDGDREMAIQNLRIENAGDDEAENVQLQVVFPPNVIIVGAEVETSSPAMEYRVVDDTTGSTQAYSIPLLNASESVNFTFLVEGYGEGEVEVGLRGVGVVGVRREVQDAVSPLWLSILAWGLVLISLVFAGVAYRYLMDSKQTAQEVKELLTRTEEAAEKLKGAQEEFAELQTAARASEHEGHEKEYPSSTEEAHGVPGKD